MVSARPQIRDVVSRVREWRSRRTSDTIAVAAVQFEWGSSGWFIHGRVEQGAGALAEYCSSLLIFIEIGFGTDVFDIVVE